MNKDFPRFELPHGWGLNVIDDLTGHTGFVVDGDWIESKDQNIKIEIRQRMLSIVITNLVCK